jgi:dephospho-CoA kinase
MGENRLSGEGVEPARRLVIGLTGPNAAGKGETANLLVRRGFLYHSLSDVVREEATARGLTHSRDDLVAVGNALRAAGGAGILAERIIPQLGRRDIVDSIRNPAEAIALRKAEGFVLVGITAPVAVRFERARSRARLGEGETLEEFRSREERENSTDPLRQQLAATLALADRVIENSSSLDALQDRIDSLLKELGSG